MEFSDESDAEASTQTEPKQKTPAPQKRSTQRAVQSTKKTQDPPAQRALPQRQTRGRKKSTAVSQISSSEDDEALVYRAAPTRRGRARKDLSRTEGDSVEEPDKMRTIDEELTEALNISIEQLRTSDAEDNPASADNIGSYVVNLCFKKKNHIEIRSRKLSIISRLFGVCVCVPKVTCCLKVWDRC